MSSSYSSLDRVLSHWVHFTVPRFICVYVCIFCVFFILHVCHIIVTRYTEQTDSSNLNVYRSAFFEDEITGRVGCRHECGTAMDHVRCIVQSTTESSMYTTEYICITRRDQMSLRTFKSRVQLSTPHRSSNMHQ